MSPVDGTIVYYEHSGHVVAGIARGYLHPESHAIVEPYRLVPSCRRAPPGMAHKVFLQCIQRIAPVVPRARIIRVQTPWSLASRAISVIPRPVSSLLEELPIDMFGFTGSYALGCQGESSDVDIVVYSREPQRLAEALRRLASRGVIRQCAPWRVRRKREARRDYSAEAQHIVSSVVESCVGAVPYTLRVLRSPSGRTCIGEAPMRHYAGRALMVGRLVSADPDRILVPARYTVRIEASSLDWLRGERAILESFRTRYADLAGGEYIIKAEVFIERDGSVTLSPDLWGGLWRR